MHCVHPVSIRNPALRDVLDIIDTTLDGDAVTSSGEVIPQRIEVPCGKCIICQNARRDMWAARMELETLDHSCAWFLTLTYNEQNCPPFLCRADLTKFLKRLRKSIDLRYFACGEYGPQGNRPHFHLIVWFDELIDFDRMSYLLSKTWKYGFFSCKPANKDNMRYVAKYTVKSVVEHPDAYPSPYAVMSRRPGIAGHWFETNSKYFIDYLALPSGKHAPLPRYMLSKLDPVEQIQIKRYSRNFVEMQPKISPEDELLRVVNLERKLYRNYLRKYGK